MKSTLLITIAALLLGVVGVSAQVLVPGLSGLNRLTLPGDSDSYIAVPFARPEAASGQVLSTSGSQITFKGAPGWTTSQFVFASGTQNNTFYLLIASGTKEGRAYTITANDANSVTLDLDGDTLTGLAVNDHLTIIPYWTLGTLFPGASGVHVSPTPGDRQTEVLFPAFNATGINASASRIFYYYSSKWLEVGQGMALRDHEIILPDTYLIVRHNVATSTEFLSAGAVVPGKLALWMGVNASGKRDNYLGLQRPTNVTLAGSGLISSGAFASSPTPGNRTDELFVYDNSAARKNKSASAIYYYWNSAWRKVGAGSAVFDTAQVFTPGTGFIIRKNATVTAPVWSNAPSY